MNIAMDALKKPLEFISKLLIFLQRKSIDITK